jgi:SAM-dependent methyltransferase
MGCVCCEFVLKPDAVCTAKYVVKAIRELLAHPATRDLNIDDPSTTDRRRCIVRENKFLWRIYDEWYQIISACIPQGPGSVLELGSGAGFFPQYCPGVITSEVFLCSDIQVVLDARQLPLSSGSLKAIAMVDVFHHIPDSRAFLKEAHRCLRPGGCIAMIEPWVSTWSRLIYRHLHHEPFEPNANDWAFPRAGPLSGANGALPWIVFQRDRLDLAREFPDLEITSIRPFMPFRYLVSGGVSMRQLMPEAFFPIWRNLESYLRKWPHRWSMFALIHVKRL